MRIGMVSHEIAGVRGGGIGTYVVEAANALARAGHEVWLITSALEPGQALPNDLSGLAEFVTIERENTPKFFHAIDTYEHAWRVHRELQRLPEFDYVEFADFHAEGVVAIRVAGRGFGHYAVSSGRSSSLRHST